MGDGRRWRMSPMRRSAATTRSRTTAGAATRADAVSAPTRRTSPGFLGGAGACRPRRAAASRAHWVSLATPTALITAAFRLTAAPRRLRGRLRQAATSSASACGMEPLWNRVRRKGRSSAPVAERLHARPGLSSFGAGGHWNSPIVVDGLVASGRERNDHATSGARHLATALDGARRTRRPGLREQEPPRPLLAVSATASQLGSGREQSGDRDGDVRMPSFQRAASSFPVLAPGASVLGCGASSAPRREKESGCQAERLRR